MSEKKQNILNFIQDYYSEYNGFIEEYIQNISGDENEDNQLKENLFNNLIELKNSIPSKLAAYGLKDSDLTSKLKKEHDVISLIQNIYKKYDLTLSEGVTKNILATTILGTQDINEKEVEKYIKKINKYTNDQIINNLYDLAFINNKNEDHNNNFKISFAKFFKESLVKLKAYEKAELYSQLNVFIEEYTKTDLGKKHIEILHKQYLEDLKSEDNLKDQKYAVKNWMMNILSAYNTCTPTENNILIDQDEKIKIKTAKGGTFDALLFINTTDIPQDRKEEFKSITKIEELNKFKLSISSISQYQISATSDKGFQIESGSVIKHCLSSLVINKILNLYSISDVEDNFRDLFSTTNIGSARFNQNMKGAITHAIKEICPELIDHLFKNKKELQDEDFFIKIQQKMNENPILFIDYLNNKYYHNKKGQDLIKETIHLTEQDMDIFNNLEKKYDIFQKRRSIFKTKSLLCLFRIEEAYANKLLDIEIKTPLSLRNEVKKHHLSTNDVILLIQFNSIVKSSYFGSESIDNKSIIRIIDNSFDIRGIGLKNKYNNELLEKFKIADIDELILNNFIYGHNSLSNLKKLNKQDMDNIVKCIVIYFNSIKDNEHKHEREKIFEKIKEYSPHVKYLRDSLNKGQQIDNINIIYEKISEIKELYKKLEEKDLIIEEKDLIIEEKDLIIEKERKDKEEKDKKEIMNLVNSVLELEITDKYFYKKINENKKSFNLFSSEEIENIKKDLSVKPELLKQFNEFLKENDLFQVNSKDLLNENFNNDIKAKEVIEEITVFINNSQNKKYKKEAEFGSTTRLENLFLSIESKIENKEILEMVKNSIEENKNHYPQIWKKLSSIEFEESINKKILKNN